GEQVVGVTSFDDYPPEAKQRTHVGGMTRESLNIEKILGLQPDLVFVAGTLQYNLIDDLAALGLNVVAFEPRNVPDILRDIQAAGRLTGREVEAARVVQQIQDELARITARIEQIPEKARPAVFYEVWHRPLRTASSASDLGQLVELAGGRNLFGQLAEAYPLVSEEAVVERRPEVILAPRHPEANIEQFLARPAWQNVPAVKNGRICFLDENLVSRPGPRVAEAIEQIAACLHPGWQDDESATAAEEQPE